jgi:membrane protein YdbS with pleckstrin-like domain
MGLPADQLGPNERVVVETREHWKHLVGAGLICLVALVGLVFLLVAGPREGAFAWLSTLGWIAFAVVVGIFGVWPWLAWRMRTCTLTNERLVTREGIIRRTGRDIPLERINDVAFDQGLTDRMSGCGTLKVSAASEQGTVVLRDIPHVNDFVRTMNALVREARDHDESS